MRNSKADWVWEAKRHHEPRRTVGNRDEPWGAATVRSPTNRAVASRFGFTGEQTGR